MTGDPTPAAPEQAEPRLVVMFVYRGVMAMDVFGPLEAFASANIIAGRPLYRLAIAGKTMAPIETSLGLPIIPSVALDDIEGPIDTLLVSGGFGQSDASCDDQLIAWLKSTARKTRRVGSVCTGAFVLAAAGLLDGRRATTHWAAADELRRLYPAIEVEPDAIYVRDGRYFTAAGVSAGMDLALALVEEDLGRACRWASPVGWFSSSSARADSRSSAAISRRSSPPARRCARPRSGRSSTWPAISAPRRWRRAPA